jgi:hypothetical protein
MSSFGYRQKPFTPAMWETWLARLNGDVPIEPHLAQGIREFRELLQARCLGQVADDTGAYHAFVARNFGSVK